MCCLIDDGGDGQQRNGDGTSQPTWYQKEKRNVEPQSGGASTRMVNNTEGDGRMTSVGVTGLAVS